jgi:hypothetical protein
MAIYSDGITVDYVNSNAQAKLAALRRALHDVADFYAWLSAYAPADLVSLGFSAAGAQDIFSAFADANGMAQIYNTGTDSRNPGAGYVYANSQRVVIGPLS